MKRSRRLQHCPRSLAYPYPQQPEAEGLGQVLAQVGQKIGRCAFSSLAASREWLETPEALAFTRAYTKARQYLNEAPASEIAAIELPYFENTDETALTQCISAYQQLGCWSPHVEIKREGFEVILDVFEYTGGISERYTYDQVCCAPPKI